MKSFITLLALSTLIAPIANAVPNSYADGAATLLYPERGQQTPNVPSINSVDLDPVPPPTTTYPAPQPPTAATPTYVGPAPQPPTIVVVPQPAPPVVQPSTPEQPVVQENSCVEGSIIGAVLGAAGAAAANEYLWNGDSSNLIWGMPSGAVVGGMIGCQIDGG